MSSLGGISLPSGAGDSAGKGYVIWADRHQWQPVLQAVRRTLAGTLHVDEAAASGGRPITLDLESGCWLSALTAQALQALAEQPGAHALVLDEYGLNTMVVFDRSQGPAVVLRPLTEVAGNHSWYVGSVRLLEVS